MLPRYIVINHGHNNKECKTLEREKTTNVVLPPENVTDKIIDEMLLEGCYVSDIFEKFGIEFNEE